MKQFYINNIKFNHIPESSIISYCESINIDIPHYCYHPNLSIAGNCRMCLVEVKNSPKPVVSCSMNVLNNMEIYTDSPIVKKSRENILEFLLLNHPLDCPICDQGGECDLQDQSYIFGIYKKRFYGFKKIVTNKNIGPIVKTVMTRCIHCTRCVRFSNEISGIPGLGTFGRGNNTEIGTYVDKIFNSELSGNVIDICPVGALTSKPYAFISRSWELKKSNSIDFSDSFGNSVLIYIKDNKIIKITPSYSYNIQMSNWISDKSRYIHTGIFLSKIDEINDRKPKNLWKNLLSNLCNSVYFHDHLNKHLYKRFKFSILINGSMSLEVLSLILLLKNKFKFIDLRKIDGENFDVSLTRNFTLNSLVNVKDINLSDLVLMCGVNTRYEGYVLNLKIRQRFLKGDLKVLSLGSLIDYTYPVQYLGLNLKFFRNICEGNNLFCQDLISYKNPSILLSSEIFKRKDSSMLQPLFKNLLSFSNLKTRIWNGYNVLNKSINDAGSRFLLSFKNLTNKDFLDTNLFYLFESNSTNSHFSSFIELKLLNYLKSNNTNRIILNQSFDNNIKYNLSGDKFSLPSNVFYENSETFLNTEGFIKRSVKVLNLKNNSKSNWDILRYLGKKFDSVSFLSDFNSRNTLFLKIDDSDNMLRFININFFPIQSYNSFINYKNNKAFNNNKHIFEKGFFYTSKCKLLDTKIVCWLDDFFVGGRDTYSSYSSVMIKCSKSLRHISTNFNI